MAENPSSAQSAAQAANSARSATNSANVAGANALKAAESARTAEGYSSTIAQSATTAAIASATAVSAAAGAAASAQAAEEAAATGILTIEPGDNVTVDDTDPRHPIVSATGGGSFDGNLDGNLNVTGNAQISGELAVNAGSGGQIALIAGAIAFIGDTFNNGAWHQSTFDATAAEVLDCTGPGNAYFVNGAAVIKRLSNSPNTAHGDVINLVLPSGVTVVHDDETAGSGRRVLLRGGVDRVTTEKQVLPLMYDNVVDAWREIGADGAATAGGGGAVAEFSPPTITIEEVTPQFITVAFQLKDGSGSDLARRTLVTAWVGNNPYTNATTPPDNGFSVEDGFGVTYLPDGATANYIQIITGTNGLAKVGLGYNAVKPASDLYVMLAYGSYVIASGPIAFP